MELVKTNIKKVKNIYITWHYTTHGIAYLKHILSAFYCGKCKPGDESISQTGISQDEMNEIFNSSSKQGFLFDKVYYLTAPQKSFDKISSRRFYYRKNIFEDEKIIQNNLLEVWKSVINLNRIHDDYCLQSELEYVNKEYPEHFEKFKELLWRDMQHYPIRSQIYWFTQLSNASELYKDRFEEKQFQINDLRDFLDITQNIYQWVIQLPKKHPNARFFINVSLGSNETQVVWHILAEFGLLPQHTTLLHTYDNKSDISDNRFKEVQIKEVPFNLISKINQSVKLFDKPKSRSRKLAELKFQNYLQQGFAILVLGERGSGKTALIEKYKDQNNFVDVNCASFDDDNKAESELFGYEKGIFTGAEKRTEGLFHRANGGILFLDEFHHLSKPVQAKLMKALQTDENNNMHIRRMGSVKKEKINCKVIMASNLPIEELRKTKLLPDLYDRVSQLIIEIPPLRETPEDRLDDWEKTWNHMKFYKHPLRQIKEIPKDRELIEWLRGLPLYGNYRDLQKIAIFYFTYLTFNKECKDLTPQKSAFEYAKYEFQKYHSNQNQSIVSELFHNDKSTKEMITFFKQKLAEWAIDRFDGAPNAEKHFAKMGDTINARTLYKWKNGK